MLETPSAKTAESMTPFASPMLASVQRFLSRFAGRMAEPPSQLSAQTQRFADRIFSRRLDDLGMGMPAGAGQLTERPVDPQGWLLADSWVPASLALRSGARSAPASAPIGQPPVRRAPDPTRELASPDQPAAALPEVAASLARPVVPALRPAAVAERAAAEVPMPQVSPTWTSAPAKLATAPGSRRSAEATPALTPVEATAPTASTDAVPETSTMAANSEAPVVAATSGASVVAATSEVPAVAARPEAPVVAATAEVPAVAATAEAPVVAATAEAPVVAARPEAPVVAATAEVPAVAATSGASVVAATAEVPAAAATAEVPAVTAAAEVAAVMASSAVPAAGASSAVAEPKVGTVVTAPSAVSATSAVPQAATVSRSLPGAVPTAAVAESASPGAAQPQAFVSRAEAKSAVPAEVAFPSAGSSAPNVTAPVSVATGGAPAIQAAAPSESRVRDLLPSPPAAREATRRSSPMGTSALARSFAHLGWSDDRLGRQAPERGTATARTLATPLAAATAPQTTAVMAQRAAEAPAVSQRAAAAPDLPMVHAADLKPTAATRGPRASGQPLLGTTAQETAQASQPELAQLAELSTAGAATPTATVPSVSAPSAAVAPTAASAAAAALPTVLPAAASVFAAASPLATEPTVAPTSASTVATAAAELPTGLPAAASVAAAASPLAAEPTVASTPAATVATTAAMHTQLDSVAAAVAPATRRGDEPAATAGPSAGAPLRRVGLPAAAEQPARGLSPTAGLARENLAAGRSLAQLSPSLLASPALQATGGATASLARLFLAGQSTGAVPSAAAAQRTPGALATTTEQLAMSIGAHAAGGSAGVGNPFGAAQSWQRAPGVAGVVSRALSNAEAAVPARLAQLTLGGPLPYLAAPAGARRAPGRAPLAAMAVPERPAVAVTAAEATPGLATSASDIATGDQPASLASIRAQRWSAGSPPPREIGTPTSARQTTAPWQLAGGMATLAELFAAGVELSSGAASHIGQQTGAAPVPGLLPSWLTKAAPASPAGSAATMPLGEREGLRSGALEFVARDKRSTAVKAEAARLPFSAEMAANAANPATQAEQSFSPIAVDSAVTADQPPLRGAVGGEQPAAAPRQSFWQQAGGLATTAEAFASSHGIERAEQTGPASTAAAQGGRWVQVTGGMVFVSPEAKRSPLTSAASLAQAARGATPTGAGLASLLQQTAEPSVSDVTSAAPDAVTQALMESAAPTSQPGQAAQAAVAAGSVRQGVATQLAAPGSAAAERASVSEAQAAGASASAPALDRSIDWRRAGGIGLRTELFAAGLGSAGLSARPLSEARDLPTWASAPGVSAPLVRALGQSEPATPSRWNFGSNGLQFLSAPSAAAPTGSPTSRARAATTLSGQPGRQDSTLTGLLPTSATTTTDDEAGSPATAPSAAFTTEGLAARPWQHAGGTAILAELFAAGVGLGAGAASGMAQQAGVAAGRSLLPGWLARLLPSATSLPSEAAERPESAAPLPFVPRDQRRPATAELARGRAATASPFPAMASASGLPFLSTEAGHAAPVAAMTATADQRPLSAAASVPLWQGAGGLAASAEAFARGRGMERTATESGPRGEDAEAPTGKWQSVSGGQVFVPQDRAAPTTAGRGLRATRTMLPPADTASAAAPPQLAAAGAMASGGDSSDWQQVGGLGLRSELFAAGLGPSIAGAALGGGDPLGGWVDAHRMLTSFLQSPSPEATPAARFAWSGPGGLLYLAGASPARGGQRRGLPGERATAARPAEPTTETTPAVGGIAALAERFGATFGGETGRGSEDNAAMRSGMMPLTALLDGPAAPRATAAASDAELPGRLGTAMLTGFPRSAEGGADSPHSLWPTAAMNSVERLTTLLGQLPAQWRPSATMVAAMQATDSPMSPLWQRLPVGMPQVAMTARGAPARADEEEVVESRFGESQPNLTLVSGSQPGAAQRAQRSAEPAWKQQTPESMVGAALQKVAGSGTPLAAAAKMLESVRSLASGQASRSDDRVSMGDLTLIALSMGENKMAAVSAGGRPPSSAPPLEAANRQREVPNTPETEDTLKKKVLALAERVLKEVEKLEVNLRERGSFDA